MFELTKQWSGDDWQEYVVRLLKLRYRLGDFQEVPDRHQGDFGIEGFSRDGHAYQCYAPEEPSTTKTRYDNQRDKITTDIGKFVANADDLARLFGLTKIRRWVFVVPSFDSSALVQHAEKKAAEVRSAGLPYVDPDFCIVIATDEDFTAERAHLIRLGVEHVEVQRLSPDHETVAEWASQHSALLTTLDQKIERMPGLTPTRRGAFRRMLVEHYLAGQATLDLLNNRYQEVFEAAVLAKGKRETFLEAASLLADDKPNELIRQTIKTFKEELLKLDVMSDHMAETLAHEAVADWLMRCPLDFPVQ
jgi:hypothetical protein